MPLNISMFTDARMAQDFMLSKKPSTSLDANNSLVMAQMDLSSGKTAKECRKKKKKINKKDPTADKSEEEVAALVAMQMELFAPSHRNFQQEQEKCPEQLHSQGFNSESPISIDGESEEESEKPKEQEQEHENPVEQETVKDGLAEFNRQCEEKAKQIRELNERNERDAAERKSEHKDESLETADRKAKADAEHESWKQKAAKKREEEERTKSRIAKEAEEIRAAHKAKNAAAAAKRQREEEDRKVRREHLTYLLRMGINSKDAAKAADEAVVEFRTQKDAAEAEARLRAERDTADAEAKPLGEKSDKADSIKSSDADLETAGKQDTLQQSEYPQKDLDLQWETINWADEVDLGALFGGGTEIEESVFEADSTIVGNKVNEEVNLESTEIVPGFGTDEGDDLFQELFLGDRNTSKSGEEDRSELTQNGPADEPKEEMADGLFGDLAKDESPSSEPGNSQSMKIRCDIEKHDFINNSLSRLAPLTQLTPIQQLPTQHGPKRTAETARLPQAKARPAPHRPAPPRPAPPCPTPRSTPTCPIPQVRCQNPPQMGDPYLLRLSAHYEEYANDPVNYLDPLFTQYQGSTQPEHNSWPSHVPQYIAQPNFNAQFGHYPHQAPQPQLPHSTRQASQAQYVPYSQPVPQSQFRQLYQQVPQPQFQHDVQRAPQPQFSQFNQRAQERWGFPPQKQMIAQFDGQHDAYATAPVHVNQPLFIRQDQLPGYPAQHAPAQSQQHQSRDPAPTGQGGHGNNGGGGNGDEGPFFVNPFAFDDQYY